jgi:hypothetical protein
MNTDEETNQDEMTSEEYAATFGMRLWTPADRLGPFPGPFTRVMNFGGGTIVVTDGGNNGGY